jgi:hypothetical protein
MAFDPPTLPAFGLTGSTPEQQQIWWQQVIESLQAEFGALETAQQALAEAQAAQDDAIQALSDAATATMKANTAQSTANTASTAAGAAQSTADTVKRDNALSASWTSPGSILSAAVAGTDTTVTILPHARHYDDRQVTTGISGGNIVGIAYGTTVYVYYDDVSRSDTTPAYHAVTNPKTAAYNVAAGRPYCGSITTPTAGGGSTSGGTVPPGGGYDGPGAIP